MRLVNRSYSRDGEGHAKLVPEEGALAVCSALPPCLGYYTALQRKRKAAV